MSLQRYIVTFLERQIGTSPEWSNRMFEGCSGNAWGTFLGRLADQHLPAG